MGMKSSVQWIACFVSTVTIFFSAAFMLTIVLKYGMIFRYSDFFLLLFLLFSFAIPTIMFCFLMSTFFSNANLAAAVAAIVFFATYLPFVTYQAFEDEITHIAAKLALSLLSNVCFGFAVSYILAYEIQGIGMQFYF